MFKRLLEDVAMSTNASIKEMATLLEEEMDEMSNTFDDFVTPAPKVVEVEEIDETDDDSILATIGSEIAADAVEDAAGVSDEDSIIDEVTIEDENGDDITDMISSSTDHVDNSISDESSDDEIISSPDDPIENSSEDDLSDGESVDDPVTDDINLGGDDVSDVTDDDFNLSDDEFGDIDPDDLLSGAFDDDDDIVLDNASAEIGEIVDDADDLAESVIADIFNV